jgi:hypothetical protein
MRQTLAIAAGLITGLLAAGPLAPAVVWMFPSRLHGVLLLGAWAAFCAVLTAIVFSMLSSWTSRK